MQEGVLVRYLVTLVEVMERNYGVAPDLLYSVAGLKALPKGTATERVETGYADQLWLAASQLADNKLGLRMGAAARYTSYASLGHLLMTSETVGDAIRTAAENAHYVGAGHFDLSGNRDGLELTYKLDPVHPVSALRALASIVPFFTLAKSVAGRVSPSRVWLEIEPPDERGEYEDCLGDEIEFGAPSSGVAWSAEALAHPMRDANPALHELLHQHLLKEQKQQQSTAARIETILNELLSSLPVENSMLGLDYCGTIFGVPRRSLQRQLAAEGHSFRDLLKAKRLEKAVDLLTATDKSVAEISHALGYSEAAAFVRAFKAAEKVSPSRYRAIYGK